MARKVTLGAAQVGAVHRDTPRAEVLARLIRLLEQANDKGVKLLVYPETTLTTFFPRYAGLDEDKAELDKWFEHGDLGSNDNVKPLLDRASQLGIDIVLGYGEKTDDGHYYNTCSYLHRGVEVGKYRKVHLPGNKEPYADPNMIDQLEKRYFEPGDYGFKAFRVPDLASSPDHGEAVVGMMICNDRRWAEAWRCLGLQGVELVCLGYNTSTWAPGLFGHPMDADRAKIQAQSEMQHLLVMQCHSYTNATFSIAAARAGYDDGEFGLIGCSCIVHPEGYILAQSSTMDDELVVAEIDLDEAQVGKRKVFNFGLHRQIHQYKIITEQSGVTAPPRLA
ncbi:carbon-nitrogen hydrolase [Papiliotrema laurentii]|uniref:Carbon-nitrogen hydrolase n=1 Tax=Papiliotrema laurentii TaxID=5418 RepID=A0AAD9CSI2_PAPLA|nr:carbon-nitrogen hydrolase [Papiliotrema laurentii]